MLLLRCWVYWDPETLMNPAETLVVRKGVMEHGQPEEQVGGLCDILEGRVGAFRGVMRKDTPARVEPIMAQLKSLARAVRACPGWMVRPDEDDMAGGMRGGACWV